MIPEGAERDFVAGAFIVRDGAVLLLHHKKLDWWLMPGGHVEGTEVPHETAEREVFEETGVTIRFMGDRPYATDEDAYNVPIPYNVNTHRIREGHWHCDFQYIAVPETVPEDFAAAEDAHKHHDIRWFTADDIRAEDNIPSNVRQTALDAIEEVGRRG